MSIEGPFPLVRNSWFDRLLLQADINAGAFPRGMSVRRIGEQPFGNVRDFPCP